MKRGIAECVARSLNCQGVKTEHRKPRGFLQPLPIPVWKWEHITIDFIVGLPQTSKHDDAIWVILDQLTKTAHYLAIKVIFTAKQLADLYNKEVVRIDDVSRHALLANDLIISHAPRLRP